MRKRILAALAGLLLLSVGCSALSEQPVSEVVGERPFDTSIFTQGLEMQGDDLLVSGGQYGESFAGIYSLAEEAVVSRVDLADSFFGEGITQAGDRILQLSWQEETLFIRDPVTLEEKGVHTYSGEGWGIAMGEDTLYMSDGTAEIRRLDPETLEETGRVTVKEAGTPVERLNELEYANGKLYANIWQTDDIVKIDPETGEVETRYTFLNLLTEEEQQTADVLNGIAHIKDDRFYITGKWWPKLFEVILR